MALHKVAVMIGINCFIFQLDIISKSCVTIALSEQAHLGLFIERLFQAVVLV